MGSQLGITSGHMDEYVGYPEKWLGSSSLEIALN
jgi:hypothetical protein